MALTNKGNNRSWMRWHLLIRLAGLTGLLVAGVAAFVAYQEQWLTGDMLLDALTLRLRSAGPQFAWYLLFLGGAVAVAALAAEVIGALRKAAGQHSAFGANVAGQIALATALLVGLNLFSFRHYLRFDWTADQRFTLDAKIAAQFARLEGETTIVLYRMHQAFGRLSEKPDVYSNAAEAKVIEKVTDLADQFAQLGPQFRVVVLDVNDLRGYQAKLKAATENAPELKAAIDAANENSIFFVSGKRVQRLSFNDLYQLDRVASQEGNAGAGNLVLFDQGTGPFARRILSLEEKKPQVAVATIHHVLSTESQRPELSMIGLGKALRDNGFEVRDILLKKWGGPMGPEPATSDYDENKYGLLELDQKTVLNETRRREESLKEAEAVHKDWKDDSLAELTKKYAANLGVKDVTERIRRDILDDISAQIAIMRYRLDGLREELTEVNQELAKIKDAERLADQRRMTDLKAKTAQMLADCDLLILPRLTILDVTEGAAISARYYRLDEAQAEAVKDFLKSGKPVLACLGPTSENAEDAFRFERLGPGGPDVFEDLLTQLGVRLGKQTVLYDVESKAMARSGAGQDDLGAGKVEVPPVLFDWKPGAGLPPKSRYAASAELPANPVRQSMRLTSRGVGKESVLDLRLRHPRPIYFEPPAGTTPKNDPYLMMTPLESWNEDQPFPTRTRTPEFRPTKSTDPAKGTLDEVRTGPFPVGIAVEEPVPASWYSESGATPTTVRLAVLGHGGLFTGLELSPAKEKLLLNLCNWLLGRDDRLPTDAHTWQYPRVHLSPQALGLWSWGLWLGLPVLFAYLGLVVLLVRRLR